MLKLYIPTRGRVNKQNTYKNLPPEWQARTKLVVHYEEADLYDKSLPIIVPPKTVTGIGPTRQWIMDSQEETKICMLDDDLRFDLRREDDPGKFGTAYPEDVSKMFSIMEKTLEDYAHVGVTAREGGNRFHEKVRFNTRMLRVLGFNRAMFYAAGARFDRNVVMEDFDVSLTLLRAGYPNVVLNKYIQGQGSSNAAGGCSIYRTMEVQAEGARRLKELHPDFVSLVTKTTKGAWGGQTRTDVMIQWKKAFESSGNTLW